ncbi:unnamed protein product [Rotaria sordida]|uniref:Regulator of telomere elongation helicase 1 homolog n=1 Tax=Rotaria sordida TaxID=392033 RepID=A0A813QVY9_9BILA|nr:unnamed protein product [Rotaria sordida]
MHPYLIDGLTVLFPFEAYQCQLDYMKAVVECLIKGQNGILESPTGTGKTLSLLCASLAWLEQYKIHNLDSNEAPIQIIYASRTHSQLSQVVKEFKSTDYNRMKITVLGSRDQLCIHPEVKSLENSSDKISVCREKIHRKACLFYRNFEISKPDIVKLPSMDIEDLVKTGIQKKFCPYFAARELKEKADIIFMPYNYLLDAKARRIHKINVRKSIVIFDEAHNIEQQCEDAASVMISSLDLAACLDDTTKVMQWMINSKSSEDSSTISTDDNEENNINTNALTITQDQISNLKLKIMKLEELLDEMKTTKGNIPSPGDVAFKWLKNAEIDFTAQGDIQQLQDINQFMTARSGSIFRSNGQSLLKLAEFIETVHPLDENGQPCFTFDMDAQRKSVFKVYIEEENNNNNNEQQRPSIIISKRPKKLHYWCLSPGFSMRQLCMQNTRSILLTSGTLSPIDSFKTQLAIPFDIVIQNDHIIEKNQLFAAILPRAAGNKHILTSVYKTRQNPEYQEALGQTLHNVIKNIPGGVLVFFPCYKMIDEVVATWKNNATFEIMNQRKRVIIEQRNKTKFENQMKEFNTIIENDQRGAMLFAVARGKLSEGIDFSDKTCRAVIIIGIPFAPHHDRRVIAKRHYLDEMNRRNKAGDMWYNQQAFRAINQCVGRVIRHRRDYGAVLFFDQRFGDNIDKLSKWLHPYIHTVDFTGMMKGLKNFFAESSSNSIDQQTTHPIQQAFFPSVTHSTIMMTNITSKSINHTVLSEDILQTTLKQSIGYTVKSTEQISSDNIRNETNIVHKSLFDAISSTQRNGNTISMQNIESDDKQRDFDAMLELKRREAARTDSLSKKFLPMMGTFEETSSISNNNNNNSTLPLSTTKVSEYRELLCRLKTAMPHGVYPRFTHMLQDHKTHKTDRTIFLKLQTLLVESLAKDHHELFMDMARHISSSFRQEYIQAGQNYCLSTSTIEIQQTNENRINNKRKDLSSNDVETSQAKIVKTNHSNNPFRCT